MVNGTDDSREQGVEFGDLDAALEDHDYPATTGEIVDEYGDHDLELPNGTQSLETVLDAFEGEDETYESAEEVRQTILTMVGDEAVGSTGYSDRGGSLAGATDENETDSF